ncbi:centrosomal protein of 70 kDa-like isoform X2 [Xenia sp. Carnegie-2017]|uniref:centrosomal protein of 70 kDa-like isoform X2 n=1 Tax=Xenia sp. Carnegie-2017 TaxID=2897299 RepID=UPI001F038D48|nr:centrosomal protein of 70 kDa-like isoform X2 [Xenia sp. Carnegie-2017]
MASSGSENNESDQGKVYDWQESSQTTSNLADDYEHVHGTETSNQDEKEYEFEEWINVNNRLKQHGFRSIRPSPLPHVTKGLIGIFLDEAEAHMLRNTIEKLLDDCERRQALVQELITSSNKLQQEVNDKSDKAYRYDREVGRLNRDLKAQQRQIQNLEQKRLDEVRCHGEEIQAISIAKADLQTKCDLLEQKCNEMEQEIARFRLENEEMYSMQNERQRTGKAVQTDKTRDKKNLKDIDWNDADDEHIDDKETITTASDLGNERPYKELESTPETFQDEYTVTGKASRSDIIPDSRQFHKATERQMEESKKLIDLLEDENNKLKAELTKRPGLDEWRKAWKYNKRLEKILMENNLKFNSKKTKDLRDKKSRVKQKTHVKDIDYLPIDICRKYIKRTCSVLNISDLKEITPMLNSFITLGETQERMEALIRRILKVIDAKNVPYQIRDDISDSTEPRNHSICCEKAWKLIIPTLKRWSSEIKSLKELKEGIIRLCKSHFPWKPIDEMFTEGDELRVEDLRKALQKMTVVEDHLKPLNLWKNDAVSLEQLKNIVAHFQKLFDVKNLCGVFPKMNEVYSKVGEMCNVMKTIRESLDLE